MPKELALYLLKLYRSYVRIILPCSCRFSPTCSEYCAQAINKHGFWKGFFLAVKRILCCHPFSRKHFFDPVP